MIRIDQPAKLRPKDRRSTGSGEEREGIFAAPVEPKFLSDVTDAVFIGRDGFFGRKNGWMIEK
jgi:hypothetical protein